MTNINNYNPNKTNYWWYIKIQELVEVIRLTPQGDSGQMPSLLNF